MKRATIALAILAPASAHAEECFVKAVGKTCRNMGYIVEAAQWCPGFRLIVEVAAQLTNQPEFKSGRQEFELGLKLKDGELIPSMCAKARQLDSTEGLELITPGEAAE